MTEAAHQPDGKKPMPARRRESPSILSVKGLKKYFPVRRGFFMRVVDHVRAVDDVDFDIAHGETLGLVGESGCGKTTIARLILRLMTQDAGSIRFDGREIGHLSEHRMRPLRRRIQIVFQDPYSSLNPRMTVAQSVGEGLRIAGLPSGAPRRRRVEELMEMVGLPPASADRYPHEFSGGQRQRIGIARALSVDPSLVICDEPISALDVSIQAQIINLLKDLQDRLGLSYLFISHDLNVVSYLCSHVAVMYRGHIVESAPADTLFDNPCHPYTRKLLGAAVGGRLPDTDADASPDRPSQGHPDGCPFLPSCRSADGACAETAPEWVSVGPGHRVRCLMSGRAQHQ